MKPHIKHIYLFLLFLSSIPTAGAQSTNRNYIKLEECLDASGINNRFTIQYYDDLGRPDESVTSGSRSLYSYNEYDNLGRISNSWSIVPADGVGYKSQSDIESLAGGAYEDNRPYTTNAYDALDRPIRRTRPGESWSQKPQTTTYAACVATDSVRHYTVTSAGNLSISGYYPSQSLLCTTVVDEDGITGKVFTDMQGRKVLERSGVMPHSDTYYVYNKLGQLSFVLSPMYQVEADVSKFAYSYKYDSRGRVIEKTIPGCQKICYWYDTADRMTCMQDGLLRSSGKYRRYFYDSLGRLVIQCVDSHAPANDTPVTMAFTTSYSSATDYRRYGYIFTGSGNGGTGFSPQIETVNYYDDYSFLPLYNRCFSSEEIYRLLPQVQDPLIHGLPSTLLSGMMQISSTGEELLETFQYDMKGRMVREARTCPSGWLTVSMMGYEFSGELQNCTNIYYKTGSNGIPQTVFKATLLNEYDPTHANRLAGSRLAVTDSRNLTDTVTIQSLVYDDWNNVTEMHRDGSLADMSYGYDLLHGWVKEISSTGGFQQKLYREDNTGHKLYNGSISAMTWKVPNNSILRRYDYTYDGLNRLTEGAYSQLPIVLPPHINSTGDDPLTIGDLGNEAMPLELIPVTGGIGGGLVGPGGFNAIDRYTEKIYYDRNSNIMGIERYGMNNLHNYGLIDSLEIIRNGNQLKTIEDYAVKHLTYTGASDFYDGDSSSSEYLYNENGALVSDFNREIDWTYYDNLGNTREICFYDQSSTEYIYAADGTKLRTVHHPVSTSGVPKDSTDYIGNLILKNGQPSKYLFEGGYLSFDNDTIDGTYYYIQDYMGNNRMVVNKNGTVEQVTHYYPYGGVIGDISTNETVQKYKFEGKELDRTFGLDNYDIHARQYFAMMPSWDRIDPLAEDAPQFSPYSYCIGNPVNFGDFYGINPIFTSNGVYICDTKEGFTGSIMIYDGDLNREELSEMSMGELEGVGGYKWDDLLGSGIPDINLSREQNESILNSFLSELSNQPLFQAYNQAFYHNNFSLDQITGSKVQWFPEYVNQIPGVSSGSHFITMIDNYNAYDNNNNLLHQYLKGEIYASGNTGWERTVENLACSIVYHEFFGHLKLGYNGFLHFLCYMNSVISPSFLYTTDEYQEFTWGQLNKNRKKNK